MPSTTSVKVEAASHLIDTLVYSQLELQFYQIHEVMPAYSSALTVHKLSVIKVMELRAKIK